MNAEGSCVHRIAILPVINEVLHKQVRVTAFFLVDEGREDPNTSKSGPLSSAHQRNAI